MQQLPQELITKALALTGKTIDAYMDTHDNYHFYFSIEKFCFYLLSPEFIEEFYYKGDMSSEWKCKFLLPQDFWIAINFFQDWNSEPLIDLLSKI